MQPDAWLKEVKFQGAVEKLAQPRETFEALYNHFLQLADAVAVRSGIPRGEFPSQNSTAAFVEGNAEQDRLLCVRAMAALYHHHAGVIGELLLREYVSALTCTTFACIRLGLIRLLLRLRTTYKQFAIHLSMGPCRTALVERQTHMSFQA